MKRAYSTLTIKELDEDQRIIRGVASTISTDRMDDVVVPAGAEYKLPLPLLWQHNSREPIGEVRAVETSDNQIIVEASIADVSEPGRLKDRLDEAWQSLKAGLVKGLSIGFRGLDVEPIKNSFGVKFKRWEWLELSAVTIPANSEANIQTVKRYDTFAKPQMVNGGYKLAPVERQTSNRNDDGSFKLR